MIKASWMVVTLSLLTGASLLAAGGGTSPQFVNNYIVLDAQGGLCGGVTIVPKAGDKDIQLVSYRTNLALVGDVEETAAVGEDTVGPAGRRYKYDWAGGRPSFGYRIYCRSGKSDTWQNCSELVELKDVKHNVSCMSFFGLGGASADYGNLQMSTAAVKKD